MKIIILPSAKEDLAGSFAFLEEQQAGLGARFLESLFSDIDSLNAQSCPPASALRPLPSGFSL
jgi:hypothetical protein